LKIQSR